MRGIEHIPFFFYFAGDLYAYIRTRSLLFLFAGENSMRGIEHVLFFFYSREKILLYFL